ncbi:MAG: 2-C-methyl-D-erythritol 2,4-cyclodiphosphate synthase [Halieaceae bacterium]|nr:2-C-methyl-D-erythritol 2,4-cyclodiphosphate synthase [Halieaceae bacterium]
MRVGHGFDVHRFTEGDYVVIGGVKIPFVKGIEAHSDGDVLIHALCDALLGASALGDIGKHFPDSDPKFKRRDSRFFLKSIAKLIYDNDYELINLDCTVVCEKPKISPYISLIRENLASDLNVSLEQVSVKATTTELLGFTGRGEGVAAFAVVSLVPMNEE